MSHQYQQQPYKFQQQGTVGECCPAVIGHSQVLTTTTADPACEANVDSPEILLQNRDVNSTSTNGGCVTVDESATLNTSSSSNGQPNLRQQEQQMPFSSFYVSSPPPQLSTGLPQLVYLQPTPYGFNVIPFQAVGQPFFTPYSPPGFPAHPTHPVVVQPGIPFPQCQYPNNQVPFYNIAGQGQQQFIYPQCNTNSVPETPAAECCPQQDVEGFKKNEMPIPSNQEMGGFFRPSECNNNDKCSNAMSGNPFKTLVNKPPFEITNNSSENQVKMPYSEDEFPALSSDMSKLKLKK